MPFTLPTKQEKHQYVQKQFDRIASKYDLTNDAISLCMHRSWKLKAINALLCEKEILNGSHIERWNLSTARGRRSSGVGNLHFLDVCTGTGDLAIRLANCLESGDTVTGLDFSRNMLEVAKQREKNSKVDNQVAALQWLEGDAQSLPFPDDTFDGAIISFGLRNLTDFEKGLAEMSRVVKKGGKVVNLDLGKPEGALFSLGFNLFFRYLVPVIGDVLQGDRTAYTYLPESRNTYPSPEGITDLFLKVGMDKVSHFPLAGGSVALHVGTVST